MNHFENIEYFTNAKTTLFNCDMLNCEDKIIFFAGICSYISAEELALYAGFKLKDAEYRLKKLTTGKLLASYPLDDMVAHTKTVYCLTQKGLEQYSIIINECAELAGLISKKRKRGGALTRHDYLVGINYLSCRSILPGCLWFREMVFGKAVRGGSSHTVCPDGVMYYDGVRYFFEEDLNTERNPILLNRIGKYYRQGLLSDKQGGIIISLHCENGRARNNPLPEFNRKSIRSIVKDMEINDIQSCCEYLQCIPIMSSRYNTLFTLLHRVRVFKDGERINQNDFSLQKLKKYLSELENLTNYYENAERLNEQLKHLYSKRTVLIKTIGVMKNVSDPEITALYHGTALYLLPTMFVGRYMEFITHIREHILSSTLTEYDKECFVRSNYHTVYEPRIVGDSSTVSLRLRNVFIRNGRKIAVEYLSFDLGAWLRCMYFVSKRQHFEEDVVLIMIIERPEDAIHFCEATRRYIFTHGFLNGQFYFVQRDELNKRHSVFGVTGYNKINTVTNKFTYQCSYFEDIEVVPDGVRPDNNVFGTTKDKIEYPLKNYEDLF